MEVQKRWSVLAIASTLIFLAVRISFAEESSPMNPGFRDDVSFMEQHTDIITLVADGSAEGGSAVAIAPAYQGRVMTSTVDRDSGASFGWINRKVIAAGLLSAEERKGQLEEHIYIFGGEERFWLGPEGGQFALFFQPGTQFEFADWTTPAAIDTEPFEVVEQSATSAKLKKDCELTNFSGFVFSMGITRTVRLLDRAEVVKTLGTETLDTTLKCVAYETDNRLTNLGENAWKAETGLPSIWLLGMYNPSPETTVVIPFKPGDAAELGPKVNDTYFGKVPAEYLKVDDDVLFFKGDGTRRGKIGIAPERSQGIAGSYDAAGQVLTIVTYNVQDAPNGYVNSMWEMQDEPFKGDVINSYNDGSPAPGEPPLGPFYELETSSPAAALKPGQTMTHVQRTLHIQGPQSILDPIAKRLLGVSLDEVVNRFGS